MSISDSDYKDWELEEFLNTQDETLKNTKPKIKRNRRPRDEKNKTYSKFTISLTQHQLDALNYNAQNQGIKVSALIKEILIENNLIPDSNTDFKTYKKRKNTTNTLN